MIACMTHERFYESATFCVPDIKIYAGSVWLEHSFAASQIFFNESNDIALMLSGECFADVETRNELQRKGHRVGESGGGWLVHLYEEEGDQFFGRLNGLFSGLLIDKRRKRAFLFNDRYGFDRIYYSETKAAIYFASEAKALLRVVPELRALSTEGVTDFLTFGCTLEGRTLFRGVHLLPGGSLWVFEAGQCRKSRYFTPTQWESQPPLSAADFSEQFEETFKRILPRYCDASARLGISLTAGLDTRMVMACRRETPKEPVCYTYEGPTGQTLDSQLAARVAQLCGLEHRVLRLGGDFFAGFGSLVDRTVYLSDGCFGALGAHEIYLNAQARQLAPVRLTGVFGSEVLRGISTFKPLFLMPGLASAELGPMIASSQRRFFDGKEHPITFAAFKEVPWSIFGSLAACRSQVSFRTPYLDNELVSLAFRLPASLQTSAAPALRVVERNHPALSAITTDMGLGGGRGFQAILRRLYSKATFKLDYFSNEGLPHWLSRFDPVLNGMNSRKLLLGHHKYLRYRSWLRKELADYLSNSFADQAVLQSPLWNRAFVSQIAEQHIRGRANYVREINAVLTLAAVDRLLLRPSENGNANPTIG